VLVLPSAELYCLTYINGKRSVYLASDQIGLRKREMFFSEICWDQVCLFYKKATATRCNGYKSAVLRGWFLVQDKKYTRMSKSHLNILKFGQTPQREGQRRRCCVVTLKKVDDYC
jgi:hypothetical protein